MAWLIDTNIISETRRLKPERNVLGLLASRIFGRHCLEKQGNLPAAIRWAGRLRNELPPGGGTSKRT